MADKKYNTFFGKMTALKFESECLKEMSKIKDKKSLKYEAYKDLLDNTMAVIGRDEWKKYKNGRKNPV